MGSAPVRHEHSLEGPVALEDLVVEPVVGAAVGAVDTVVRAHDGPRMALLHGRAERGEVDLAQGPLADVLVDGAALGLLVVRRKMLHRRDDALALDARRDLAGEHAREERVLRQVLEVAPVLGHPVDVYRGPEHGVDRSGERRVGDWSSDVCSSDLAIWLANTPARNGSSDRYSKLRPFWGTRLMFTAGPSMTLTPRARASLPTEAPYCLARSQSHEAARPMVAG